MSIARLIPGLALPVVNTVPTAKENGDLKWALAVIRAKTPVVRIREAYYNGDHRLAYATKEWRSEFGKMLKAFNANYCPAVVDVLADRLRLVNVDVLRNDEAWDEGAKALNEVWQANNMDRRAGSIHTAMLKHGETYLTVWPNTTTEEVTYYLTQADRMAVRMSLDEPDRVEFAAKIWLENKRVRATLYYDDHIERWATPEVSTYNGLPPSANPFEPLDDDDWWVSHDYGMVPVVPFINNPNEAGDGRSELDDVIPLQDALNLSLADMLVALEFAAFPQRWATGLTEARDPITGEVVNPLQAGVERLWTSDSPESTFGQFQTATMRNFVDAQDAIRADIARVSRTPMHYLLMTGNAPSGESLRVMESPLMAKVNDRQDSTGPSWESVARLTLIEQGSSTAGDRDVQATARWKDTATRSDTDTATAAQLRLDIHGSKRQAMKELGYEESDIDEILEDADANAIDVAQSAQRAFDQGRATGFEP